MCTLQITLVTHVVYDVSARIAWSIGIGICTTIFGGIGIGKVASYIIQVPVLLWMYHVSTS